MFRKNVASQVIHFQGVDSSTGGIKSGVSWTVRRCIDGTFAAATGTVTEDGTTGWYKFAMSQADTNGNNIGFNFTGTGAVPQTVNIVTTVLDPTSTAFGLVIAKTTNITGFNDIAATAIVSSGAITTSAGAVSTVSAVTGLTASNLDAAVSSRMATYTQPTGFLAATFPTTVASPTNITGGTITTVTNLTNNNDKTGYSLSQTFPTNFADLAITASTGRVTVGTNADKTGYSISGTKTTLDALNDISAAGVNAEVDTAIADARLDELLAADSDIDGAAPPTVGSVFHELMTKTAGSFTYDQTTDSLEAVRDRGDAAWVTATGFSTHSAADVWTAGTRRLSDGTNIVLAKGVGVTGFNDIAATDVVSAGAITTSGGVASADVKKVNAVTVTGTGAAGDEWGPL